MKYQWSMYQCWHRKSLPLWERGLKYKDDHQGEAGRESLPLWERGLKFRRVHKVIDWDKSLPLWERGLKFPSPLCDGIRKRSLPLWERGLKFTTFYIMVKSFIVAPLVGAWIEIKVMVTFPAASTCRSPCGSVD